MDDLLSRRDSVTVWIWCAVIGQSTSQKWRKFCPERPQLFELFDFDAQLAPVTHGLACAEIRPNAHPVNSALSKAVANRDTKAYSDAWNELRQLTEDKRQSENRETYSDQSRIMRLVWPQCSSGTAPARYGTSDWLTLSERGIGHEQTHGCMNFTVDRMRTNLKPKPRRSKRIFNAAWRSLQRKRHGDIALTD